MHHRPTPAPRRHLLLLSLLALLLATGLALSRSTPTSALTGSRVAWQGGNWYLHGANVPWYNWGCDFGCNSLTGKSGGVSTNSAALQAGFAQAQTAHMHVLRWWVFPGNPWQITKDASGAPTGINPAVYPDFDAALKLAQQYDLYYDFVLFCGASSSCVPNSWLTNTTQRAQLAQALGTLFARYANNPRILSWEVYNEPDFDVWNGRIDKTATVQTAAAITAAVHANSPAYVTVGTGFADGMAMFNGIGLDYYSPHWYDYMSSGTYCLLCHTAADYAATAENKPIVVGEFYSATATSTPHSSAYRFNYWYSNGFAGDWGWSLFPSRTNDHMAIDLTAAQTFASQHTDIGPSATAAAAPTLALAVKNASGATVSTVSTGAMVHASATLTGATTTAGGTVTYSAYSGTSCTGTPAFTSKVTVTNAVVPDSSTFTPAAAGNYTWQAAYSGDALNQGVSSACGSAVLSVSVNTVTITDPLSASSVTVGTAVHDTATLSGATSTAGGSVTYHVYSDSACTTAVSQSGWPSTVTVANGTVASSANFTPQAAGTYYFQASYSGDAKNSPASSTCGSPGGTLTVSPSSLSVSLTSPTQGQTVKGTISITASVTDNVSVTKVQFFVDGALYKTVTSTPYTISGDTRKVGNGSHTVKVTATDASGNTASASVTVTVAN